MSTPPARWSPRSISRPSGTTENGLQIIMIGHAGHPETVGTMGQLPEGEVLLVETVGDVDRLAVRDPENWPSSRRPPCRWMTRRYRGGPAGAVSGDRGPHKEDICYATTNRQEAVKAMAAKADAMLVVGAPNSSNSRRLVEVGARRAADIPSLSSARETSTGAHWKAPGASASPPGPRLPKCWWMKWSRPSRHATT